MSETTLPPVTRATTDQPRPGAWLSRRQLRYARESVLAYLFLLPALLIIGAFGLFPLIFALYQSTLRGLNTFTGRYDGLSNYVRATGDLAYVLAFWSAILFIYLAVRYVLAVRQDAHQRGGAPWLMALPGLLLAGSLAMLGRFTFATLTELLLIPEKLQGARNIDDTFLSLFLAAWGKPEIAPTRNLAFVLLALAVVAFFWVRQRRTRHSTWRLYIPPGLLLIASLVFFIRLATMMGPEVEQIQLQLREQALSDVVSRSAQFRQLIRETFALPAIRSAYGLTLGLLAAAVAVYALLTRLSRPAPANLSHFTNLTVTWLLVLAAGGLGWLTWVEIQKAYAAALEAGESLALWSEVVTLSAGFVLLLLSWLVWRSASFRSSNLSSFVRLTAGALLILGAWVLIGELPRMAVAGDTDWWLGLQATIFYSAGTIPVQLVLSLAIATLLFQDLKGKGLLRVIYFLPYITPVVAAAAVFRVFFSDRATAPMNTILSLVGVSKLDWLAEPTGVFQLAAGEGAELGSWLAGPSLALVVIMLFGIWKFIGFNIVVFLAGLGNISRELYEAASIDGAGRWAQFRNITLPLLSPTIYFLTLWAVIGTFKSFNSIWVLRLRAALGTTDTASIVIFNAMKRDTRYGYAAALAILLLLIILLLTYINNRVAEKRVFYG